MIHQNIYANGQLIFIGAQSEASSNLIKLLTEEGFQIMEIQSFSNALNMLAGIVPQVIILNSSGNELSAFEFCSSLRSISNFKKSVVIMLSDKKDELMEMTAFNSGVDDFLTYPIRYNVLLRRIKVRLKQPDQTISIQLNDGSSALKIDLESYSVSLGNNFLDLSKKEFELLYLLASNPEKLFRREEIFMLVWNKNLVEKNRTLDVHIARLRKKLDKKFISSQKGIGYRLKLH